MSRQLVSLPMVTPGAWGLNTQESNTLLPPQFMVETTNTIIDSSGRLAARRGLQDSTTTPISGNHTIQQIHEYRKADGTTYVISAANNDIFHGVSTFTDITGTLTPAGNNWEFMNFEDKVIGVQDGETPIFWNGTGNFADITAGSGSLPTGGSGCAAFGRLWITDTGDKTIKYCGLLDETDWGGAGAGTIVMENIWDVDSIMGIYAAFNRLIVFGKRHIVIFADAIGSTVGMDPSQMFVEDVIQGTGLAARDSVQNIGEGDLWFLSPHGVQSIKRVIQEKNNPVAAVTDHVRDYINNYTAAETGNIRSAYNKKEGFYLLHYDQGIQFYISTKVALPDGTHPVTAWLMSDVNSVVYRDNDDMIFGTNNGEIATYQGTADLGVQFRVTAKTGWLDLGQEYAGFTKIFKKWSALIFLQGAANITMSLFKDFETQASVIRQVAVTGDAQSEWNEAEWNIGEWSGGLSLREIDQNIGRTGQYVQLQVASDSGAQMALQQFNLIAKQGRLTV